MGSISTFSKLVNTRVNRSSVLVADPEQSQKQAEAVESSQGRYQVNERRKTRGVRRPHKEINKQGIDALHDELQYQWKLRPTSGITRPCRARGLRVQLGNPPSDKHENRLCASRRAETAPARRFHWHRAQEPHGLNSLPM